jgi:hypothetical protein
MEMNAMKSRQANQHASGRLLKRLGLKRLGLKRLGLKKLGYGVGLVGAGLVVTVAFSMYASAAPPKTASKAASNQVAESTASTSEASTKPAESTPKATKGAANSYGIPQVEAINELARKSWTDHHLTPSPVATDGQWCRRVFLDVIGRIPRVDELEKFLTDHSANRKLNLVNRLLGDEYVEEYARHWSNIWTTILIGRSAGSKADDKIPVDRDGMAQYLRDSFGRNKPYQVMVKELVSAKGSIKPGDEGYNGAANFLSAKMEDNGIQATAKTAQIFLGLSVQCTQCHNHPFNDWKQEKFWEMNAFFRQTKVIKTMAKKKKVEDAQLVNVDFRGEGGDPQNAELYYEQRNGIMRVAYPVFVDGQEISRSGFLKDVDRRTVLANMIIASPYMSRAIVNRMWGHFMGYGFTKPVDDMGPHNPPSNPDLLERLANDFSVHQYANDGYDLKQLMRWIVLSEPYALSSRIIPGNRSDDPNLGEKPQYSHFYLRQMSAEELYESLLTATSADKTRGSSDEQEKAKQEWLKQFVINFGTDDGGETTTFNGTIPQTLMMFNGSLMKGATAAEKGSVLDLVANNSRMSPTDKINYLYLAGLSRKPNHIELELANQLLMARRGSTVGALQDVWWAVLNSNEFIINH